MLCHYLYFMVSVQWQAQSAELSLEPGPSACILQGYALSKMNITFCWCPALRNSLSTKKSLQGVYSSSIILSLRHVPFGHGFLLLYSEVFAWEPFCQVPFRTCNSKPVIQAVIWSALQILEVYWDPQLLIKINGWKFRENRFSGWRKIHLVFGSMKHQHILSQLF